MKKIPLESTLVGAYRFLFTNIVSIIGTMWFPVALLIALVGGLVYLIVPHEWLAGQLPCIDGKHFDAGTLITLIKLGLTAGLTLFLGSLLVRSMIAVGILRHSVGEKTSTTFIYFSLGARVWKMLLVILFAVVVYCVLEIAALVLFGILNAIFAAVRDVPPAVVGLSNFALGVVVVVTIVYVLLRLFFFLPAVVVAEHRFGVSRAWALGKGNAWRILAIMLMIIIPVQFILGIVLYMTVIPTIVLEAIKQHPDGPEQALTFVKSLWPLLPVIGGILLVAGIAMSGLTLGAMGIAYRAVTAPDAGPQVAPAEPPAEAPSPEAAAEEPPAEEPPAEEPPAEEPPADEPPAEEPGHGHE